MERERDRESKRREKKTIANNERKSFNSCAFSLAWLPIYPYTYMVTAICLIYQRFPFSLALLHVYDFCAHIVLGLCVYMDTKSAIITTKSSYFKLKQN